MQPNHRSWLQHDHERLRWQQEDISQQQWQHQQQDHTPPPEKHAADHDISVPHHHQATVRQIAMFSTSSDGIGNLRSDSISNMSRAQNVRLMHFQVLSGTSTLMKARPTAFDNFTTF